MAKPEEKRDDIDKLFDAFEADNPKAAARAGRVLIRKAFAFLARGVVALERIADAQDRK